MSWQSYDEFHSHGLMQINQARRQALASGADGAPAALTPEKAEVLQRLNKAAACAVVGFEPDDLEEVVITDGTDGATDVIWIAVTTTWGWKPVYDVSFREICRMPAAERDPLMTAIGWTTSELLDVMTPWNCVGVDPDDGSLCWEAPEIVEFATWQSRQPVRHQGGTVHISRTQQQTAAAAFQQLHGDAQKANSALQGVKRLMQQLGMKQP